MIREGILNIDKPTGMTSHDVVNRVRRVAGLRRVGHAGTLDPLATGVLLVALGRATRLLEYLVGQPKTYVATVRLGQTTDTYDADGDIVSERPVTASTSTIAAALDGFRGNIDQRAPAYSAIKQDGQPLHRLVRQGQAVEAPLRAVTIYELELLDYTAPLLQLRAHCSTGTYVRSLAHDLGEALGCGGHIVALRRSAVGDFDVAQAVALDALQPATLETHLLPPETAVAHLPRLELTAAEVRELAHGRRPPRRPGQPDADLVRACDPNGRFVGVVSAESQSWRPRKLFVSAG